MVLEKNLNFRFECLSAKGLSTTNQILLMRKFYSAILKDMNINTNKLVFLFILLFFFSFSTLLNAQTSQRVIGPNDRACDKKSEEVLKQIASAQQDATAKHNAQLAAMRAKQAERTESVIPDACTTGNIISDGGFETTNPTTFINAFWASTSTNFGTSLCNAAACGTGGGTATPRTGSFWAWFGGVGAAEVGTVQQSVIFPTGSTSVTLNYYLRIGAVAAPFDATLRVLVDGVQQQIFTEPSVAEATYTLRSLDLSAFADGLPHMIRFEYNNPSGSGTSNFTVDDISLDVVCPACTGVPSPGFISGPSGTICSGSSAILTLNGYTTGGGITYQWKSSSTSGGPYTTIPGATNTTYTANPTSTTYYICTVTCTSSGFLANTAEFAVNVNPLAHINVSATPSTTCSPGSVAITGTAVNGVTSSGIGIVGNSGTINLAIPDNNPAGVNSTIALPAINIPDAASLKVRINANHSWVGDLIFKLTSPCGVTYLFDRPGVPASTFGNSDNLGTSSATTPPPAVYTFDIAGATVLPETTGGAGFIAAGTYKPSDINGASHNWAGLTFPCNGAGNWVLNISDNGGGDLGTLVDWQILGPTAGVYTHSLTGPGTITQNPPTGPNNATANFSITNIPAGTHTYTLTSTDMAGCSVSSPVSVTVNQTPVVTLVPTAATICAGDIQQIQSLSPPSTNYTLTTSTGNAIVPGTTLVTGTQADDATALVTLPFTYKAYGTDYTSLRVGTNGNIQFTTTSTAFTNVCPLPASAMGVAFHPHWDDLNMNAGGTLGIYTSTSGTAPNRIFNIEWRAVRFGGTNPVSFEARLFEGQQRVDFIYGPCDLNGGSASIGVQNFASGLQTTHSCNTASLSSGLGLSFAIPLNPVTFSPLTELYTNAAATTAYTGTPITTVYAKPSVTRTYTATATNAGCVGTATSTITVNQLPAITVQPAALAAPICPGFNVTYTVTATGAGLTYQWQLSTDGGATYNNIINNPPYTGATTNALTITNVTTAMNNYRYRVTVSGTCPPPVTSNAVTLVVATPPTITTQPTSRTVCAGVNTTFTVVAAGIPAPTIYQWQVSTNGGGTWTNLTTGGSYTPSFTITGVTTAMNANQYRVIVTNSCGQFVTSSAAVLTVNPLPVVTATPIAGRICLSDGPIPLTATPVGGTWSGIGISGFNFVPAATAVGTFDLTYTFTNTFGCTATSTIVAKVEDCPERIRLLRDNAVILYPNPNNGNFNIRINSILYNYLGMNVYSSSGQLVKTQIFNGLAYGRVVPIDLTFLPSGTYMVKFFYDDGIRTSEKTFPVVIGRN